VTTVPPTEAGEPAELGAEASNDRFVPYYTLFSNQGRREFVLVRPFVPFSRADERTELQAYMVASSDPDTYGELTVYTMAEPLPDGPLTVANTIERDDEVTQAIARQTQSAGSSSVRFGDLQLVPIGDGLLYVRPFYVTGRQDGTQTTGPEYQSIVVWYDGDVAIARTLGEAIGDLFPGLDLDVGDRADSQVEPEVAVGETDQPVTTDPDLLPGDGSVDPSGEGDPIVGSPAELLAEADRLLSQAETELRDGDLGAYQNLVNQAGALVDEALAQLNAQEGGDSLPRGPDVETTVAGPPTASVPTG
jgi:hypothetical protein